MLRYAVVGAGAVGGFYGIRLAAAGAPVQFLVRSAAEQVRAGGLHLASPSGDVHLAEPLVASDWGQLAPCDVLVVAVKATANADVLVELARHGDRILPSGALLLAQNGIGAEPDYAEVLPGRQVLGGLAFLCAQRQAVGRVAHLDFGTLTVAAHAAGEAPAGVTPAMTQIAADLTRAGVDVVLDDDLVRARWRKLMWNVPFNPLSVVLDATTDALMADPDAVDLVRVLMGEVAAVSEAEGRPLPAGLAEQLLAATARMAPYATSMKLDADAGRPLEVDALLGAPLRRAAARAVPTPAMAVLHHQLSFLDRRGRRG